MLGHWRRNVLRLHLPGRSWARLLRMRNRLARRQLHRWPADPDGHTNRNTSDDRNPYANSYANAHAGSVTHALALPAARRGVVLVAGLLLGVVFTTTTLGTSWENPAFGLGIGLAALVGLAQTCSA